MAPRFDLTPKPPALDPFDGSSDCAGCGASCDPDGLCDECLSKREEYGAHRPECRCDGCRWYLATDQDLHLRGLK